MPSSIPNRGPELLAVDAAFMATAVIANALRCYVRIFIVKAFGVDDWTMLFATVSFIAYSTSSMIGVVYGTGRHHSDLPEENVRKAMHCWWFCYLFYCTSMILSKISIGCFLLRIAIKKVHSWIIYGAMCISVVAGTVFFFVTLFQCKPISYFWNKSQAGTCINIEVIIGLAYLYSVFAIISDFTFAILPGFLVWHLQLKPRTKMALIPLLTMGCIASAAVVTRVPYLPKFRLPDFLWNTLDTAIWSTVEQGLAITAGSLATLRPLFHIVTYKLGLSTTPSRYRPSNYGAASPSASNALGSRRKPSQNDLNFYNLSNLVEAKGPLEDTSDETKTRIRSPSRPHCNFPKSKHGSVLKKGKAAEDNESQESLHASELTESFEHHDGIMISKSFFTTSEKR